MTDQPRDQADVREALLPCPFCGGKGERADASSAIMERKK